VTAARTLLSRIRTEIEGETHGQRPRADDYFAVAVAYVTPDLSALGFTPFYSPGEEERIERYLNGNVAIGLVFGVADDARSEIFMGTRPFLVTKQTEAWLSELTLAIQSEMVADRLERQ
jgi:hypothetical protein